MTATASSRFHTTVQQPQALTCTGPLDARPTATKNRHRIAADETTWMPHGRASSGREATPTASEAKGAHGAVKMRRRIVLNGPPEGGAARSRDSSSLRGGTLPRRSPKVGQQRKNGRMPSSELDPDGLASVSNSGTTARYAQMSCREQLAPARHFLLGRRCRGFVLRIRSESESE
jgi:hypothetical protein